MRGARWSVALLSCAIFAAIVMPHSGLSRGAASAADTSVPAGIHKIKHVVIIMQENRSFDSYFGTFPGADGIPMRDGVPTACLPNPSGGACVRPYHDANDANLGGPHGAGSADKDVDGGKMDGFTMHRARARATNQPCPPEKPECGGASDVMGYHDQREIPNYWTYARDFVLQDRLFEPIASWSLPQHLVMVSEWSATCQSAADPMSCRTTRKPSRQGLKQLARNPSSPGIYPWTDLTYLLHQHQVSWAYYVMNGLEPDCADGDVQCKPGKLGKGTPGIWNVLPGFVTVRQDGEVRNIQDLHNFYAAAKSGTLPAVSWICPNQEYSEHPPHLVSLGQAYVTGLINAVARGPDWNSTAIFVSWDDWGGFYDHVEPPRVNDMGYGLRVPGLVISPYAKRGFIDHQVLSHDAYNKFIEDVFLDGERLDPQTDGRADSRPSVPEKAPQLGNLMRDFDFDQAPRKPVVLPHGSTLSQSS